MADIPTEDRRGVPCSNSQDLLIRTSEPIPGIPRSNSVCVCAGGAGGGLCTLAGHVLAITSVWLRRRVKVAEVILP